MDVRQLRYFVAVAEERHITRAARRLGLQQPPLSQAIHALEAELGGALFVRGPRGVELTAAGTVLLAEARDILASVARASRVTKQAAEGRSGAVSVGFTTSAMLHPVVPEVIRAFRGRFPDIRLNLQEGNAAELTERLQRSEVELGFLRLPVSAPDGVTFRWLLDEELVVVLPLGHRLLGAAITDVLPRDRPRLLDLAELAGERFILVRRPSAPGIYANVMQACRAQGFEPEVVAEVAHMLTNINLVAAGMGISLVPASMREINLRQVAYCPLRPVPGLAAPLTLAYPSRGRPPALEQFLNLVREMIGGEGETKYGGMGSLRA